MTKNLFTTPVLFCIFNRLDTAKQVFSLIQKIKPEHLYIASDGPRKNQVKDEMIKVQAVRDYVLNNIDWPCKVKTLFREENLGCNTAITGAITWFFQQEEQGIILEDDCLPTLSFFTYCEELLDKYKDDKNIYHIAGYTPIEDEKIFTESDYGFACVANVWGWATWRRAWQCYSAEITNRAVLHQKLTKIFSRRLPRMYFEYIMRKNYITWDYLWTFSVIRNDAICITPYKNMVLNIGMNGSATHDAGIDDTNKNSYELTFPLRHPKWNGMEWNADLNNELAAGAKHILRRTISKSLSKTWKLLSRELK